MHARLISYSQPAKDAFIGVDTPEDLIAYAARVSNPSNQINSETAPKLLRYLIKHQHKQQETSQDNSYDTVALVFNSFLSGMLTYAILTIIL